MFLVLDSVKIGSTPEAKRDEIDEADSFSLLNILLVLPLLKSKSRKPPRLSVELELLVDLSTWCLLGVSETMDKGKMIELVGHYQTIHALEICHEV